MNNQFDELTKSLAQSVTRRDALRKFSIGLAVMTFACIGLANKAHADKAKSAPCATNADCGSGQVCCKGACVPGIPTWCDPAVSCCCYCDGNGKNRHPATALTLCDPSYNTCSTTCSNFNLVC